MWQSTALCLGGLACWTVQQDKDHHSIFPVMLRDAAWCVRLWGKHLGEPRGEVIRGAREPRRRHCPVATEGLVGSVLFYLGVLVMSFPLHICFPPGEDLVAENDLGE